MDDGNKRSSMVAINLGLEAGLFEAVAGCLSLAAAAPVETVERVAALQEAEREAGGDGWKEICLCFNRKMDPTSKVVGEELGQIGATLEALRAQSDETMIERILLVDCGDSFMDPLSNTAILALYLEVVRDFFEDGVETVVFTADDDANTEAAHITLRDTRTEAFVEHVARFTRLALRSLYSDIPEETGGAAPPETGVSFETVVEQVLRSHEVPIEDDGGAIHWLRRAV